MTPAVSRVFLFLDEWIGIALLVYLWRLQEYWLFGIFLPLFLIAIYVVGYPRQWRLEKRHEERP